ncbi:MAG: substrate-binding domain-containing protein [Prevotella sp.]|nr:substrate-binding domain-containing protein [Prevotella sp.]
MKNIITFLLVLLLASCSEQEKIYHIGVSQCSSGQWREKVNREMLAAQHLYDYNALVTIAQSYDDTNKQIKQIDSLADAGIDLLVVAPNESAPITPAINRVRKKGIPVIFFDRKAETTDYTAFIGGDNVEAGQTVGQYAVQLAKGISSAHSARKPLVLEITGAMSTSPAQERHKGFSQVLQSQKEYDYICVEGDWTSDNAYKIFMQQIEKHHVPDIVFCHNDGMTTGVSRAVKKARLGEQVKILGIDGMPEEGIAYIQQGSLHGTYVYPTHGEEIVRLALNILTGEKYERENKLQGMMVTPENVEITALNSRELIRQNDHLITIHDKLENYFGLYNSQHKMLIASLICIAVLIAAFILAWRAYIQTRKTIRKRQSMNEEQTLFYADASRRKVQEMFTDKQEMAPALNSQDMLFAEKLNEAIRKNMSNPNLKMDDLGEEVGLSRVQLYRKVKSITGLSPVELLRQIRLQQAYVLLGTTTKTVAEIAFEVGFNTPGYFSKCFREQYGKLPMDLRIGN